MAFPSIGDQRQPPDHVAHFDPFERKEPAELGALLIDVVGRVTGEAFEVVEGGTLRATDAREADVEEPLTGALNEIAALHVLLERGKELRDGFKAVQAYRTTEGASGVQGKHPDIGAHVEHHIVGAEIYS